MKTERRSKPRVAMLSDVIVSMGGEEIKGRGLDVSTSGIAFASQIQKQRGAYLRIRFKIPQLNEWVDVDAVLVRLESKSNYFVWAVSFQNPEPRSTLLIKTYVREKVRGRREGAATGTGVKLTGSSGSTSAKGSSTTRSKAAGARHAMKVGPMKALYKEAMDDLSSDKSSKKKKDK